MTQISKAKLFGKLNSLGYRCMEAATTFCKMRGNPYVELVHIVHQILQLSDSDLHRIAKKFSLDPARLVADIQRSLDELPRGASSVSDFSPHILTAVESAWLYASLGFNNPSVRTGHLFVALTSDRTLRAQLTGISDQFSKIKHEELEENLEQIVAGSPEDGLGAKDGSQLTPVGGGGVPGQASGAMAPASMGKEEALKQFTHDLTERARSGEIDPIVGRDAETRQIIDILMRRRQNNPILTGEAGVGKTAAVEGFAHKIVQGDVPPMLKDARLLALDMAALSAGASMKGEFENRLKSVIEEIQGSPKQTILFIDEAHTLIGAGGQAGTGDAANLLKPALARGTLRTIAATTWAEYKKHIEKDPALTRRFQVVQIDEPSIEKAILMMRKMAGMLEKHHRVPVLDEAIEAAVKLSAKYIPARQLPDKCVSLLDTACARVAIGQHSIPPEVDDSQKRIDALNEEIDILKRESDIGFRHEQRIEEAETALASERERLATLREAWKAEKDLVDKILELRAKLRGPERLDPVEGTGTPTEAQAAEQAEQQRTSETLTEEQRQATLAELRSVQDELAKMQGKTPLILPACDANAVAGVVESWTGIPVGNMVADEVEAILKLGPRLGERVFGQQHALDMIAKRIQTSIAKLDNPGKPTGVFMLAGPSGVGKTETALALAECIYGDETNVITINMSEYQEAHTVSTLKGSPPGYVGYGEGGVLTEAVRRKPYSIVLLDEVEKAHPDVHEIFFQVFDKGTLQDGEGRVIDFKNTILILTTNVGTDLIMNMCKDPELLPDTEGLAKALREPLLKVFPPALLGRITTIPYFPLSDDMIRMIAGYQLDKIVKRTKENRQVALTYTPDVIDTIAGRCTELDSGGRMIDAIVTQTILPDLSTAFLTAMLEGREITKASIGVKDGDFDYSFE